jgi:hypothetical protein
MADSALQMPAQEPIHKLIVFIFWAILFAAHLLVQPNYGDNTFAYHLFPGLVEYQP